MAPSDGETGEPAQRFVETLFSVTTEDVEAILGRPLRGHEEVQSIMKALEYGLADAVIDAITVGAEELWEKGNHGTE